MSSPNSVESGTQAKAPSARQVMQQSPQPLPDRFIPDDLHR